jgi:hypothetical protein
MGFGNPQPLTQVCGTGRRAWVPRRYRVMRDYELSRQGPVFTPRPAFCFVASRLRVRFSSFAPARSHNHRGRVPRHLHGGASRREPILQPKVARHEATLGADQSRKKPWMGFGNPHAHTQVCGTGRRAWVPRRYRVMRDYELSRQGPVSTPRPAFCFVTSRLRVRFSRFAPARSHNRHLRIRVH